MGVTRRSHVSRKHSGENSKSAEIRRARRQAHALCCLAFLLVLVPYYTFMFLVSTQPQLFAARIGEGSVITIGWPIAALIVIGGWLLTGVTSAAPMANSTTSPRKS
ncbi:MAG: DUF485 domain-containing protein [Dechloromonas sp.]|nr:MAG: DUF485 domain-containing protein [Dechloromonas sp.]